MFLPRLHREGILACFLLYVYISHSSVDFPILNFSTHFHKSSLRLQPLPLSLNLSFQISLPAMAASSSRMGSSSSSSGSNSTGISWSLQFHLSLTSSEENSLDPKTTRPNYMKVYHQQPPLVQIVGFKLPTPSASTRSRPVSLHQVGRHPIVMLQL